MLFTNFFITQMIRLSALTWSSSNVSTTLLVWGLQFLISYQLLCLCRSTQHICLKISQIRVINQGEKKKPKHACGWKPKDMMWGSSEITWIRIMDQVMTMMLGGEFFFFFCNTSTTRRHAINLIGQLCVTTVMNDWKKMTISSFIKLENKNFKIREWVPSVHFREGSTAIQDLSST